MAKGNSSKPDYGIDAPNVLRNLLVIGVVCLLIGAFGPRHLHFGPVDFLPRPMFLGTGTLLVLEGPARPLLRKVRQIPSSRLHAFATHVAWR